MIGQRFRVAARRLGLAERPPSLSREHFAVPAAGPATGPAPAGDQMDLF